MSETDKRLKALEKKIKTVYTKAYKELKEDAANVLQKIEFNPDMSMAQKMGLMSKYDRLEKLSQQMADTVYNANTMAQKMIDNEMVNIYGLTYNAAAENFGFDLVDNTFVKKVLKEEVNPFEMINSLHDKTAVKNKMKGEILTGLLKGESIPNLARRLKGASEGYLSNSIRVARTETTRVMNSAKMDVGKRGQELGFDMWKRWVATKDDRTRHLHDKLDGQEVPLDEPFTVDGEELMFPGDISRGASAGNVINCRCTMVEFIKEPKK